MSVVNIRKDEFDVLITRATDLGNPFPSSAKRSRLQSINEFMYYAIARIKYDEKWAAKIRSTRGKRLGCFCAPQPCHGDIIEWLAAK